MTMGKNRVVGYLTSHFLGNQSLAMSFFVNGVIFYLLMVAAVVGLAYTLGHFGILTNIGVAVGIVLLCGLAWSLTGNVLAAAKALKNPSAPRLKKTFAVCILCAVTLTLGYIVRRVLHIRSLYG
jgi:arginine exporter protein ArgO